MSLFRRNLLLASASGGIVYTPISLRYNRVYNVDSTKYREYTKLTTGTYDDTAGITYYDYNYSTNLYFEKTGLVNGDSLVGLFTKSTSDFDTLGTYALIEDKSGTGNLYEAFENYRGLPVTNFYIEAIIESIKKVVISQYINSVSFTSSSNYIDVNNIKIIQVDSNNTNYYSSDNVLFSSDNSIILGRSYYSLPNDIVKIGSYSFSRGKFNTLTIPSTYTYNLSTNNSDNAFCFSTIGTLNINTSILGRGMFSSATINQLNINTECSAGNTSSMGYYPFFGVTIQNLAFNNTTTIGNGLFGYMHNTSITIPSNITIIGTSSFVGSSNLATLVLPNGITTIGNSAFAACLSLSPFTIPSSVTSIGSKAFSNSSGAMSSLTSLTFAHSSTDTITLPVAGSSTGFLYCKTARNMTIYTDNETIKNYDYASDNITATILHIDGSAW